MVTNRRTLRAYRFRRWAVRALAAGKPCPLKKKLLLAAAVFLVAFATKSLQASDLAPLMYTSEQPFNGLTETYDLRAVSILKGEGLLGPYAIDPSDTKWLGQAPGYSIFLSAAYKFLGRDFFAVQPVQNALNSLSAVLILLIAGSLVSWRVGALSGFISALSHHLGHISNFILPDALHALPVLAAIYLLLLSRRSSAGRVFFRVPQCYWFFAAAGASIGLASWLRAQTMLLGIFLILPLAMISLRKWPTMKRAVLMAAISLLAVAPITIRNYAVYGEFLPIQLGTGLNLWEGLGDASGDRFGAVKDDMQVAAQEAEMFGDPRYAEAWTTPDGIMRDRDRTRRSLAVILRHPVWYAGVMLDRCGAMLRYTADAPLVFTIEQAASAQSALPIKRVWREFAREDSRLALVEMIWWLRPPVRALQRIAKETMLPFIIIGACVLFSASRRRGLFIAMVPLYYFIFQSAMHTEFRYTLPMQHFLFVFAALSWVLIWAGLLAAIRKTAALYRRHSTAKA